MMLIMIYNILIVMIFAQSIVLDLRNKGITKYNGNVITYFFKLNSQRDKIIILPIYPTLPNPLSS